MKDVSGPVFRLAGVNSCTDKDTTSVNQTPADNIFTGFDIVDDAKFYEDITKGTDIISENKISILNSDKQLVPPPLGSACKNQKSPNLEVISSNKLKISSECDFYYVNPYLYYPGWFATDGKDKSKAFPAFGFLQGYRITAGSKEVEFVYFPSP
jgi:hypothetical protein